MANSYYVIIIILFAIGQLQVIPQMFYFTQICYTTYPVGSILGITCRQCCIEQRHALESGPSNHSEFVLRSNSSLEICARKF